MAYSWKPQVGCLMMLLVPMALAAGLTEPLWNWERHALPAGLKVDAVLTSSSNFGLREGCQSAIYRLSDETAEAIKRGGLAFLESTPPRPRRSDNNPYGPWQATKGDTGTTASGYGVEQTIYGMYATTGCSSGGYKPGKAMDNAWFRPGSYYKVTANREGVIIVDPEQRLVGFFYVG